MEVLRLSWQVGQVGPLAPHQCLNPSHLPLPPPVQLDNLPDDLRNPDPLMALVIEPLSVEPLPPPKQVQAPHP